MYNQLNTQEKQTLLQAYLDKYATIPEKYDTYESSLFPKISRQVINMMCSILGYDNDKVVNEIFLGFMSSIYPSAIKSLTRFKFFPTSS
jgi:hypothetical protein